MNIRVYDAYPNSRAPPPTEAQARRRTTFREGEFLRNLLLEHKSVLTRDSHRARDRSSFIQSLQIYRNLETVGDLEMSMENLKYYCGDTMATVLSLRFVLLFEYFYV